jgi:lectin-like protein
MRWLFALMVLAGCRDLLGIGDGKPKPDAAVDAAIDTSIDAGPDAIQGCAGFVAVGTLPHLYKRLANNANWPNQRDACVAAGGYLVVPDDATELQGITTFAGNAMLWIGISDIATDGNYMTVLGQTAVFLPWGAGQPSGGTRRCVQILANMQTLATELCGNAQQAVCECAP